MFFSVTGISDEGEMTVMTEDFGTLLLNVLERSNKCVCLCVDSKIGKRTFFSVGSLDDITHVISNVPFSCDIINKHTNTEFISTDM